MAETSTLPASGQSGRGTRIAGGDRNALRGTSLFAGLPEAQVERLLVSASMRRCPAGTTLFRQGERADRLHLLLAGIVELCRVEDRREHGVMMLSPGDVFMTAAALFEEPYLTSARVLSPARLLLLDVEAVRRETSYCPVFAMMIARIIAGQWRMAVRHILDLKCRSAPERLAAFLLRLVDESPSKDYAELPVPKRNLASRVGMTAETLSRALQVLADNGLLVRGNRILVRDRPSIDRFCGPDPYPQPAEPGLNVHIL